MTATKLSLRFTLSLLKNILTALFSSTPPQCAIWNICHFPSVCKVYLSHPSRLSVLDLLSTSMAPMSSSREPTREQQPRNVRLLCGHTLQIYQRVKMANKGLCHSSCSVFITYYLRRHGSGPLDMGKYIPYVVDQVMARCDHLCLCYPLHALKKIPFSLIIRLIKNNTI